MRSIANWSLARDEAPEREDIGNHLIRQFQELSSVPAEKWRALLEVQGATPLSLAALSWAQDAKLSELMALWATLQDQAKGAPESALDGLRFINPELLPPPAFAAFVAAGFHKPSEWKFLSLIFKGQTVTAGDVSQIQPEIVQWFQTEEAQV